MKDGLTIDISASTDAVVSYLKASEESIRKATTRAVNDTARWFLSQSRKDLQKKTGLKRTILNPKFSIKRLTLFMSQVSFNASPIRAKFWGTPVQEKAGARAGKQFFPKAFVAKMSEKRGYSVYKRKGAERFPVSEQGIDITPQMNAIFEEHKKSLPLYFEERWNHHLEFYEGKE